MARSRARSFLAEGLGQSRLGRSLAGRLPHPVQRAVADHVFGRPYVRWGNMRRMEPFSNEWGFDRGQPVDRVYIEGFLERHARDLRGAVLEVQDSRLTDRFGDEAVTAREVLDIDVANTLATIVGDLSDPATLPQERFDCFILTETLQLVPDLDGALRNAYSALRPGGVLLITVPVLSRIDPLSVAFDSWRITANGMERLIDRCCQGSDREVRSEGNLIVSVAFLQGLCSNDLRERELSVVDPSFPVVTTARVVKPPGRQPHG